jgi:uncharacterized protein YbjT (DUF2867 family)
MLFILGATGQIGTPLTKRLAELRVPFRAVVRSDAAAQRIRDLGGEPVLGDLSQPESLAEHMRGISKLFLLTPGAPEQVEVQRGLVDLAKRCDVGSVVKLSVYTAEEHSPCSISRWHWHNDEYLKSSGAGWTILYPHTFMQNQAMQFGHSIRERDLMCAAVGPEKRFTMVDVRDVADVSAAVLTTDGHDGKEYLITGPEALSYADCAAKLSAALGRRISYHEITTESALAMLTSAGLPFWLAEALVELYSMYDTGTLDPVTDVTARLAGHPARSYDEFLADNLEMFK